VTERDRRTLHTCLQSRRAEIEETALTRVQSISDPAGDDNPEYAEGLRLAVSVAIDYGLSAIEHGDGYGDGWDVPPPAVLLTQARIAARNSVALETVLRRYFAGYTLLCDFLIEEADAGGLLDRAELKYLLRAQASVFDRLLAAVADEYAREVSARPDSSRRRRAECVRRLLDGELVGTSELDYDFDRHHLGLVLSGVCAEEALREGLSRARQRSLVVSQGDNLAWGWLGSQHPFDPVLVDTIAAEDWPPHVSVALGEPLPGLAGWRLTLRQARAALPLCSRRSCAVVRYRDVALLASMVQDDVLSASLRCLYLDPLDGERDGGAVARETLRAYFAAERNLTSAAAKLGVSRRTVTYRLHAIEERLGRPLRAIAAEVEAALHLDALHEPHF